MTVTFCFAAYEYLRCMCLLCVAVSKSNAIERLTFFKQS